MSTDKKLKPTMIKIESELCSRVEALADRIDQRLSTLSVDVIRDKLIETIESIEKDIEIIEDKVRTVKDTVVGEHQSFGWRRR